MGIIKITIDAEVGGKHASKNFEWEANDTEIAALMRQIETQAAGIGATAQAVVQATLHHLPAMDITTPVTERGLAIHATYFVLSQFLPSSTGFPDNTRVCDVAGHQDVEAHIRVR